MFSRCSEHDCVITASYDLVLDVEVNIESLAKTVSEAVDP